MPPKCILEDNPYLAQHATNPINWHTWEDSVLFLAKQQKKLIFLSIGYSTCHWCHVMNREVFNDPEVGNYTNDHFIAIKVDREEFPDVDEYYMNACQIQNGTAGWPLNCILSPDTLPVYTANYMPKNDWLRLLRSIQQDYERSPSHILDFADQFKKALTDHNDRSKKTALYQTTPEELIQNIEKNIDREYGGIKGHQKFMMPSFLKYSIDVSHETNSPFTVFKDYTIHTLYQIALSTIFDSVHGGIFRYSTTPNWNVPHFEKMLYDQAQMISLFAKAYDKTKYSLFKEKVRAIFDFSIKYLKSSNSLFYSAMDAESNGTEGFYYAYTYEEFCQVLTAEELEFLVQEMEISEKGNWENGLNLIFLNKENYQHPLIGSILEKLKHIKSNDYIPFIDKKVQLSWNALMISGLCDAHHYLGEKTYIEVAIQMERDIESNLLINNRLIHSIYKDKLSKNSYLEDYVYYINALRSLNLATGIDRYEQKALAYFQDLMRLFEKDSNDLFYKTGARANAVSLDSYAKLEDDIMPSPNGILQSLLHYFGLMNNNNDWIHQSKQMSTTIYNQMVSQPIWYAHWLLNDRNQNLDIAIKITGKQAVKTFRSIAEKMPYLSHSIHLNETDAATQMTICLKDRCLEPIEQLEDFYKMIQELESSIS